MSPPTGHFTQVVWKASTELGVGFATDGKKVFVCGQYRPAGNMVMPGYFEKNVALPGKSLLGCGLVSRVVHGESVKLNHHVWG